MKKGFGKKGLSMGLFVIFIIIILIAIGSFLYFTKEKVTPKKAEVPRILLFNVTDIFYKTIDSEPYAVLFFDISTLNKQLTTDDVKEEDIVYVRLFEQDGYAQPVSFSTEKPSKGTFIAGRIMFTYPNEVSVSYAFDTIKIPALSSKDPTFIRAAKVSITTNGTAQIDSLIYR